MNEKIGRLCVLKLYLMKFLIAVKKKKKRFI